MTQTRILIVEDQDDARESLRRLAERQGFEVTTAGSLAEAIAALDESPECVVLDLMLPDGEGETLLAKVRKENLPIRVVAVVTGSPDVVRLQKVNGLRPDLLLYKPIDHDVLLRVCKSALRN
jgi:DNA-binding response OmpR family regulator